MKEERRIKVIVTKIGLDPHDRGAQVVASLLRDAGMEVVYLGRFQTPESIVRTAMQEDADVIGISCLSAAHVSLIPDVIRLLKENNAPDILVIAGGIFPEPYATQLKNAGVGAIFTAGATSAQMVEYINSNVRGQ